MDKKAQANGPTVGLGGKVKIEVLDAKTKEPVEFDYRGNRVRETPWKHNLILNNAMSKMEAVDANFSVAEDQQDAYLARCYVGTGSREDKTDSGTVTASQSGTTITLSGSLAAVAAGRVIKWDSGEFSTVVSGSGTSWATHSVRSKVVSSGEFTVFHTEESALAAFHRRSSSYASQNVVRTNFNLSTGEAKETIVYDFAAESGSVNINEVGFGDGNTSSNDYGEDLFSRVKLDGAVTILAGEQLRVTYVMTYKIGPLTDTTSSMTISGWDTGAITERCVALEQCLNLAVTKDFAGSLHPAGSAGTNENHDGFQLHAATAIPALTLTHGMLSGAIQPLKKVRGTYDGAGSYSFTKATTFQVNEGNSASIRGITMSRSYNHPSFMCLFANAVEKADTHKLTVSFRIMVNPEYVA